MRIGLFATILRWYLIRCGRVMLDAKDKQTLCSLRLLNDLVRQSSKPVLLWVGAGASAWAGYPLWGELAESFHRQFLKYEAGYNKAGGLQLLDAKQYPRFFQLCRDTQDTRYYKTLAESFGPKKAEPVYERFIGALAALQPLQIVTTNIDEMLEHHIPAAAVVQRTDLERCADLLHKRQTFICKLHGTVSGVKTAVLTNRDYAELVQDPKYLPLLKHLFIECSVVFVGYSLSDQYVLSLLADTVALRPLFGDGPHFVISTSTVPSLPESVHVIRYVPEPHRDHRTAIQVLELLDPAKRPTHGEIATPPAAEGLYSAHFVSDLYPPGAWLTSQELPLLRQNGEPALAITGLGWSDAEFPNSASTAMHDLVVGLLCFDHTYVPLDRLGEVLRLLGEPVLASLVASDALRFISSDASEVVFYPDPSALVGRLANVTKTEQLRDSAVDTADTTESEADVVKRQIHDVATFNVKHGAWAIVPGHEEAFEKFLQSLERQVETPGDGMSRSVIDATNALMMFPQIRAAIGISGGTPLNAIPRWTAIPVLRLANVVRVSLICERLRLASTKLFCGSADLAARAFSAVAGRVWADDVASYVLAGRYNTDLGEYVMQDPSILRGVLAFRETQIGVSLRRELFAQLLVNEGRDIVAAINASLSSGLPPTVLEKARNQMSGLFLDQQAGKAFAPMVWRDMNAGNDPLRRWRARSFGAFKEHCLKLGIGEYDRCPCGSGEKVRFCCQEALRV